MCKRYAAGTCKRKNCSRAHEGDEEKFHHIVDTDHVAKLWKSKLGLLDGARA
jgi:hypothetical protein